VRTFDEIRADAADKRPFSNGTEFELWADRPGGCWTCTRDEPRTETWCPILSVVITHGVWPTEWQRREHRTEHGSYEVVGDCTEYDERPDDDGDDDDGPGTDPGPPPVVEGQLTLGDLFGLAAA